MNWRSCIQSRYPLAVAAGLLLACAFPNLGVAGFAWIAPGFMLLAAGGRTGKQTFRLGWVSGLAHYLASLSWLLRIPVPFGFIWAPALGWLALGAFLSLFMGAWVWLCWKIFPAEDKARGQGISFFETAGQIVAVPWAGRMAWTIAGAALWAAMEMVLARIFGGFPWNLLGDSQYRLLPLIQIASTTGVYGVSFLVVWMSLALLCAGMVIVRRPALRSVWVAEIFLPMLVVGACYGAGFMKLRQSVPPEREVTVALVQPSIPQTEIWDEAEDMKRFQELLRLSELALANKPDLLIWPEAAVPKLIRRDEDISGPILGLARSNRVWLIIGADDFEAPPGVKKWEDCDFYNSSFLISPEGKPVAVYKKRKLVMFGEYIPLYRALPFLKWVTPITGGFTPGDRAVPFEMPGLKLKVGVLICFEDIFPQLAREYVDDDTDFLVNLTNNGWFGEGSAQRQHAAAAVFRAIENGLPLVRCANNGLTCWVDAHGAMKYFESSSHGIYGPGYMLAHVPVLGPGEKRAPTFYRRHGDWFGWACVAFTLLQIVRLWTRSRQPLSPRPERTDAPQ